MYCEIIIDGVGRMFVASEGNPCTRNYIPTNVDTSICLVFIYLYKIEIATDEITSPRTRNILVTHEHLPPQLKMISQYAVPPREKHSDCLHVLCMMCRHW